MKNHSKDLSFLLQLHKEEFSAIMDWPENRKQIVPLDLTAANKELQQIDIKDTDAFQAFISKNIEAKGGKMGIGGYLENRSVYCRSDVFSGIESRCLHLGIDVWAPAFSKIYAPLAARIHSFHDNNAFGDYGPTIILSHELEGQPFYTLYGHLSRQSLKGLSAGQQINKGEIFAELGPYPENGDWPAHLHFQLILDMDSRFGDFPGVAAPSELEKYRNLCPDPQLLLQLPA